MPNDRQENGCDKNEFGYMEELSRAYAEAFQKRIAGKNRALPEEKRDAVARLQGEISRTAGRITMLSSDERKKELARMVKESAEEVLRALDVQEVAFHADPLQTPPFSALLSQATLHANRCLNLLVRHTEADERVTFLILSELSALYGIAAIN